MWRDSAWSSVHSAYRAALPVRSVSSATACPCLLLGDLPRAWGWRRGAGGCLYAIRGRQGARTGRVGRVGRSVVRALQRVRFAVSLRRGLMRAHVEDALGVLRGEGSIPAAQVAECRWDWDWVWRGASAEARPVDGTALRRRQFVCRIVHQGERSIHCALPKRNILGLFDSGQPLLLSVLYCLSVSMCSQNLRHSTPRPGRRQ